MTREDLMLELDIADVALRRALHHLARGDLVRVRTDIAEAMEIISQLPGEEWPLRPACVPPVSPN